MSNIRVNAITDEAGTGAPDFPNGLTGLNVASAGNISQILLNRPSAANFLLDKGVYNANFSGGSVTGSLTAGTTSIGSSGVFANLIPVMSGGTTSACSNGAVSCSVTPAGSDPLSKLFDSATTYFQQYTSNTMTVTVDLGATTSITAYAVDRFLNDLSYQPRAWTFEGSANNSTWVTLDSYNSTVDMGVLLIRPVTATYRYYRWLFTANNGQPSAGGYVIDNLNLLAPSTTTGSFTSETYMAAFVPTIATVRASIRTATAPVSGTTFTLSASRDNGTTWTILPFTVFPLTYAANGVFYVSGTSSIASQPSGTQMKYKIEAASAVFSEISAVTLEWS